MLFSAMETQVRQMVNDTDATNPFHTQAAVYLLFDNWLTDIGNYLKWPRKNQVIAVNQGQGGGASIANLNNDVMVILGVYWEPLGSTAMSHTRLYPTTEAEMSAAMPAWRNIGQQQPTKYMLLDAVSQQANVFPVRAISTDFQVNEARNLRVYYIQNISSGGSANASNSPVLPPQWHPTGLYYAAWQMMLPKSMDRADYYRKLYMAERAKVKTLSSEYQDDAVQIWDMVQAWTPGPILTR